MLIYRTLRAGVLTLRVIESGLYRVRRAVTGRAGMLAYRARVAAEESIRAQDEKAYRCVVDAGQARAEADRAYEAACREYNDKVIALDDLRDAVNKEVL